MKLLALSAAHKMLEYGCRKYGNRIKNPHPEETWGIWALHSHYLAPYKSGLRVSLELVGVAH